MYTHTHRTLVLTKVKQLINNESVGFTPITVTRFFLEGPRSRPYGRTAALRLVVQPYNEDEDDDYYFLSFSK
jgi:hypothetical protein